MDSNFYMKRQEYKYMLNFPDYRDRFLKKEYISTNLIMLNDFTMLYEARQAFLRNNEWNLKRLDDLEDISLMEFCKLANIELKDINPEITLKTFIESKSNLCPVQIEFPRHIGAQFFLEISFGFSSWDETLAIILQKINELYNFTFVVYHNQIRRTVHVPLEVLALTNGYMFDFCTESFNNGTMTSIQLPKELQSIDYYCEKIKALIDYKKVTK